MNAVLRRRLEMAMRVRDFLRAHPTEEPQAAALAHLEELLQRAEALAAQQRAGVVATRSATMQREELRRGLQTKLLRYLAAVGAVAAKESPELAAEFKLPRRGASLVSRGLSQTLLEDLSAALTEFENTLEASRTGRREHVGASADLQAVAAQISEQVRLLDGLVRYRFGDNAELMGAWASARNVLGPFRSKGESQGNGEQGAGAGPAEVKPAA